MNSVRCMFWARFLKLEGPSGYWKRDHFSCGQEMLKLISNCRDELLGIKQVFVSSMVKNCWILYGFQCPMTLCSLRHWIGIWILFSKEALSHNKISSFVSNYDSYSRWHQNSPLFVCILLLSQERLFLMPNLSLVTSWPPSLWIRKAACDTTQKLMNYRLKKLFNRGK